MAGLLDSLRDDDDVRAVVLDIDSGGGGVIASDAIHLAALELAEVKPLIAYIREVGASGAYQVACAAARIVAFPTALVGSIGVLSLRPVVAQLLDRVGVQIRTLKMGRLKDMGSPFHEPTPEEEAKRQELLNSFYDHFVEVVAQGRKMSVERVRELATGEVFTARRAFELGLIDELGTLDRAIDLAAEMAHIKRRVSYFRARPPLLYRVLDSLVRLVVRSAVDELGRCGVEYWRML